jgi:2-polyprenyl-3-methyl-5-hydroxy-6-metoxy-1,4-benzoquinol methylase
MKPELLRQNTYDQFADRYAQAYDPSTVGEFNFNRDFIIPQLLQMAGDVDGLTVLDAGCGEGIVARLLAGRGARVTGIDISPRFIELAKERDEKQAIIFELHDLSRPLPHYTQTFDLVVSNMVLNDLPDYQGFITTLSTMLKPTGRIVLSMNNPYSALIREKVDNYFDSGKAVLYNMAKDGVAVYYFHHTMEEYMTAFQQAGLLLRRLSDLHMTQEMAARLPALSQQFPWFPMYHRFPFMLILELVNKHHKRQVY